MHDERGSLPMLSVPCNRLVTPMSTNHCRELLQHFKTVPRSSPLQREASRYNYSFSKKSVIEQLEIWDGIWKN